MGFPHNTDHRQMSHTGQRERERESKTCDFLKVQVVFSSPGVIADFSHSFSYGVIP